MCYRLAYPIHHTMYISWDKGQDREKFEDCCLVAREDWTEELIGNLNIKILGIVYCS